ACRWSRPTCSICSRRPITSRRLRCSPASVWYHDAMKSLLGLFGGGGEGPSQGQIAKAVKAVTQPHGDPAVRMSAADRLKGWGTPEAIAGLLRRFTIQTPSGSMDLEECQQVEGMLVELGKRAVEPILIHL